jgi:hypothetical protein
VLMVIFQLPSADITSLPRIEAPPKRGRGLRARVTQASLL